MRLTMIAALAVTALAAAGCADATAEADAVDDARDKVRQVSNAMYGTRLVKADDIGHHIADLKGVEVLNVSGAGTGTPGGVRVTVRVSGVALRGEGLFRGPGRVTANRCFELAFDGRPGEWDTAPPPAPCPDGAPPTFAPWPEAPPVSAARIEGALPKVNALPSGRGVEERDVRAALAKLGLHPAIRIETEPQSDFAVGVSLYSDATPPGKPRCVLARVSPGKTKAWVPSPTEARQGCKAHIALGTGR
ncbi:hypothetical protein OG979_26575 [Actinomadura citrea]|uniref:hypothetical protein n=1 Tax=Actinomadura citrea TaxID=46158 RepID=UPI002E2E41AE|nr:hypothetical protein [Actinomadura citrea]